jgi:hypothetical protein
LTIRAKLGHPYFRRSGRTAKIIYYFWRPVTGCQKQGVIFGGRPLVVKSKAIFCGISSADENKLIFCGISSAIENKFIFGGLS